MIRFVVRFLGMWLLAGGFVALVLDGVRSIASSQLVLAPFGLTWEATSPGTLASFQSLVETNLSEQAWEKVMVPALAAPLFAVLGTLGIILLLLGRRRSR
ncbi:hypothetical protein MKI84_07345 [Ancylobacter sp. A5.8]|uniref:hypothetical protein n=1 Tax=Ancylobacter gelatini TaxID=2919920 RepID=UPI001F4EE2B4|nr:hypothetical protein [Ancylobacter gelatini]MCJ8142730.1 hypothetical protein [Ancylobacter gelatini]